MTNPPSPQTLERYNARESEPRWQDSWDAGAHVRGRQRRPPPEILRAGDVPLSRRGASTWATCATTRWATWWRATSGPRASTCCTRWAGTPSACRPRTPRCERKTIPSAWTYDNIATMRAQLQVDGAVARLEPRDRDLRSRPTTSTSSGCSSTSWQRAWSTRKQAKVNWDPVDMTVLANEQVIDGRGWRSGALVEQRELTQWFFKISRLRRGPLAALDTLERWPEKVRLMQRNWIGRSRGPAGALRARADDGAGRRRRDRDLHDASRHAVRREVPGDRRRPSAGGRAARRTIPTLAAFIAGMPRAWAPRRRRSRRRRSSASTPASASRHPFDPGWHLPVYVANFVLMDYGTGAIFGCPAHDQRDLDFATQYGLGDTPVVCPPDVDPATFVVTDTAYRRRRRG